MAADLAITFVPATPPTDPNWGETVRYHRSGPEKLRKLHFYFHDIVTGDNPTAISIARAPVTNSSPTAFGFLYMMGDPLTETANPNSKLLGRARGLFGASSAHNEISLIMGISIVFTAKDRFKGSTMPSLVSL
ncbi:dirigent protein 23-like [Papaver somniferum]|uniref:dirigent protein 23-like n=1 Tax=Papaver somniferum TaxID=3469 RepID=UPI000E7041E9|nr:dirigent protein 23-like [Papaver somniferum]